MHNVYAPSILLSPQISCPKCQWQGKGTEIQKLELTLTQAIELFCPTCHGYLGFINVPGPEDAQL
jgi:hypothetical protein